MIFVLTAVEGGKLHSSLKRHTAMEMTVGGLDMWDKANVVRDNLATHRKALSEEPFNNQVRFNSFSGSS